MVEMDGKIHEWAIRLKWRRFGVNIRETWGFMAESQYWPLEKLRTYRDRKLRLIVAHAYEQSPAYRRLMDGRAVRPVDV